MKNSWQRAKLSSQHDFRLLPRLAWRTLGLFSGGLRPRMVQRAVQRPVMYQLPSEWVCAGAEALQVNIPTRLLQLRMADWISHDGRVLHAFDHFLLDGDWSGICRPIRDSRVYQEVQDLLVYEENFIQSVTYQSYIKSLRQGRVVRRAHVNLTTIDDVNAYYDRSLALLRSIQQYGFVEQPHAIKTDVRRAGFASWRSKLWDWQDHGLGIAINANGEVIRLPGGQHRTAIALLLGLPTLPVQLRVVHPSWVRAQILQHNNCDAWSAIILGLRQLTQDK